jgi:hypothetical protein
VPPYRIRVRFRHPQTWVLMERCSRRLATRVIENMEQTIGDVEIEGRRRRILLKAARVYDRLDDLIAGAKAGEQPPPRVRGRVNLAG